MLDDEDGSSFKTEDGNCWTVVSFRCFAGGMVTLQAGALEVSAHEDGLEGKKYRTPNDPALWCL